MWDVEVRRAQSRGEWLGVSWTFRRGLVGMEVWVGGSAREFVGGVRFGAGERFGRGEGRGGGAMRVEGALRRGGPRMPPVARWAELRAGKEGAGRLSSLSWSSAESLKEGTEVVVEEGVARGVVGEEGFLKVGGGGGGIIFLSSSSFFGVIEVLSSNIFRISFFDSSVLSPVVNIGGGSCIEAGASPLFSTIEGLRSHVRKDHVVGGCL